MPEDGLPDDLFALLGDEYARCILRATSEQPMSASQLSDVCDASPPTVYRRIERLKTHDLLAERTRIDEAGNHHGVFRAQLGRLTVELSDGEFRFRRQEDPADRFVDLWGDL